MKYKIILASSSPRRQELIKNLGFEYAIRIMPDIDETYPVGLSVEEIPLFIARSKAESYRSTMQPDELLITADTVVVSDNKIMGKPSSRDEAIAMLKSLSGKQHKVITAVVLMTDGLNKEFTVTTMVDFAALEESEIVYYVDTFNPYDKAGAYGIQEWIGFIGVSGINGSFYNVMGLPVQRVYQYIKSFFMT